MLVVNRSMKSSFLKSTKRPAIIIAGRFVIHLSTSSNKKYGDKMLLVTRTGFEPVLPP